MMSLEICNAILLKNNPEKKLIHIQYPNEQTVPTLPVSALYAYPEMNQHCLKHKNNS
jgi:hypothetical protein